MSKDAVIFGYSGHAYVMIEMLFDGHYNVVGYYDKEQKRDNPYRLDFLGTDDDETVFKALKRPNAFVAIGDNKIRSEVFKKLNQNGIICPNLVHNKSYLSASVETGAGIVVMPGAVINARAKIGNAVICNSSSVIEHECIIGDYAHIAPGAVLAGNVTIGNNSFVGANSVIRQGIRIGSDVIIGAGSVVIKDIADGLTVYGNPAKAK
jgi:sugar O-acyltransferase (sialic acid O-acetyltransferase NeuD family)